MAAIDSAGIALLMLAKRNSFICYHFLAATILRVVLHVIPFVIPRVC